MYLILIYSHNAFIINNSKYEHFFNGSDIHKDYF